MRNFYSGRRESGDGGQLVKNLLQCQVFAANDVSLARLGPLRGADVSACALGHVDQVEAGIHVGRELPVQKINDGSSRHKLDYGSGL